MMNARELHDWLQTSMDKRSPAHQIADSHLPTIFRALDLLAATEDSTDEIVRELWSSASRPIHLRATAALVAMRAAKEKAEADLDRALEACKDHLYRMSEVEAERDGLKQAFDLALTWVPNDHATRLREQAYRAVYKE